MPKAKRNVRGQAAKPVEKASPKPRRGGPRLRFIPVTVEQIPGLVDVLAGAYPLFMSDREKAQTTFHDVHKAGYPEMIAVRDREDRVVGGYAFYDYVATILGRGMPAAGLGMVGTALDHKKEHIALELVRDFVKRARQRRMPISLLYPFRHDFYGDMGWGAIGLSQAYTIRASSLPLYPERTQVRWVQNPEWETLDRIHRSAVGRQRGLGLSRHSSRWKGMLRQPWQAFLAGPEKAPEGYLLARFAKRVELPDNFHYDLEVVEMDWTTPQAMRAILGFLSSQRDQVMEVTLDWPIDGHLDAILRDPVRSSLPLLPTRLSAGATVGHGVMLRLENPREAFRVRPYAGADRVALSVSSRDPLFENREIQFRAVLEGERSDGEKAAEVRLSAGLAVLSRLWAGALTFSEAVSFGLAEVAPAEAAGTLERLFAVPSPWVVERF